VIVALDQAFGDFRVFSKGSGRLTEIRCFPSRRLDAKSRGGLPPKT
jgi:hypothetical protein